MRVQPRHPRHRRGAEGRRLRRGGAGDRRGAARSGHPGAGPPQGPLLRRRAAARRAGRGRGWRWWAPAASASTSPSSWSTRRRRPARRWPAGWPSGAWPIRSGPAAAWSSPAPDAAGPAGLAAAAQGEPPRRRAGQDHRLDPPRRAQDEAGGDAGQRQLRAGRRPGAHHQLRQGAGAAPAPAGRPRRALHRAGVAARARGAAARRRAQPPRHRRRRRWRSSSTPSGPSSQGARLAASL